MTPEIAPEAALAAFRVRVPSLGSSPDLLSSTPILLLPAHGLSKTLPAALWLIGKVPAAFVALTCGIDEIVSHLLDPEVPLHLVKVALQGLVPSGIPKGKFWRRLPRAELGPFLRGPCEGLVFYMLETRPDTRGKFVANGRVGSRSGKTYEVDIFCEAAKLIIEIDGPEHNQPRRRQMDEGKMRDLEDLGYRVRRFSNHQVMNRPGRGLVAYRRAVETIDGAHAVSEFPKADTAQFGLISPGAVVKAYLVCQKKGIALGAVQKDLRPYLHAEAVDQALGELIERGEVSSEKTMTLLGGKSAASSILGRDAGADWDAIKKKRLPLIALGFNPDDGETRRRFSPPTSIKAAVIAIGFGLPREIASDLKAVRSEFVWRILRAGLPDIIGKGPFPVIEKPGKIERTLICGVLGVAAKTIVQATNALAARAVGLDKGNLDVVKERLVATAVSHGTVPNASFAGKVIQVASKLSTPPFQGRVAIAQVYDQYGELFPDAGSLASFKDRLIKAAINREIQLGRLDLPERMSDELRLRSKTLGIEKKFIS